jgi:hypothetical protein
MEVGALTSSPAIRYAPRAAAADGAAEQLRQVSRDAADTTRGQAEAQNTAAADATRNTNVETARKEVRESRDAQRANASSSGATPRIHFKDSEGTRVMEVYDSKDILIYQVPTKGLLALIHSQENQPDPQIETSA